MLIIHLKFGLFQPIKYHPSKVQDIYANYFDHSNLIESTQLSYIDFVENLYHSNHKSYFDQDRRVILKAKTMANLLYLVHYIQPKMQWCNTSKPYKNLLSTHSNL